MELARGDGLGVGLPPPKTTLPAPVRSSVSPDATPVLSCGFPSGLAGADPGAGPVGRGGSALLSLPPPSAPGAEACRERSIWRSSCLSFAGVGQGLRNALAATCGVEYTPSLPPPGVLSDCPYPALPPPPGVADPAPWGADCCLLSAAVGGAPGGRGGNAAVPRGDCCPALGELVGAPVELEEEGS